MKPNFLETFDRLLEYWREGFSREGTFRRVRRLTFGMLMSVRLHLTSNAICATGRQFQDWTGDYRVCSHSPWDPHRLFDPILDALPSLLEDSTAPVRVALDDTLLYKTGRHIPGVTIGRDPLSPPFHVNLRYGLRFVQASVLVAPRDGAGAARALPVRFELAPPAVKPKARVRDQAQDQAAGESAATDGAQRAKLPLTAEQMAYQQERKRRCLPQVGLNTMHDLRREMDQRPELRQRRLIVASDASYATRLVLRGLPERTTYIGRVRKDAKLCWPLASEAARHTGRPRRYGAAAPTPEQILKDETIPWTYVRCFAAGEFREIPVKVLGPVCWRNAGADILLQVVVLRPLGYRSRKGGKLHYRRPAFLICTDPELSVQLLVQTYVYRWEIECNHRDEKSLLGVGQGQVRNPEAVRRLPQLQVAGYSLLLLASLLSSGFQRGEGEYLELAKWRHVKSSARPSVLDLLNLLRNQIFALNLDTQVASFGDFIKPRFPALKSSKLPLSAETLCTFAA